MRKTHFTAQADNLPSPRIRSWAKQVESKPRGIGNKGSLGNTTEWGALSWIEEDGMP